jgi:hypothetical protein
MGYVHHRKVMRRFGDFFCIFSDVFSLRHRSEMGDIFNAGIKSLRATLPNEIFYW